MRSVSTITLCKLVWATLLACCLQATIAVVAEDSANSKSGDDDNLQIEGDMPKRDWNRNLQMWGKRGWNNLHGGWGLKRSIPSVDQMSYSTPVVDKRAWTVQQHGWGKGFSPSADELAIQELAAMLEQEDNQNIPPIDSDDFDIHEDEKRNWNKFSDGWGKRNKWEKFRGSWGKREPAWSNLKGIWGKRSVQDQF